MIMRHIDRTRSTGGGMALSFAIHAGLLLVLGLMMGHQAAMIDDGGELTEIAYIEATYGEDVAAKVKLRQKPSVKPQPPGRGVNTDNAFKPKTEVEPTQLVGTAIKQPEIVAQSQPKPRLQQAVQKSRLEVPKTTVPAKRPAAVQTDVVAPVVPSSAKPKVLASAEQLDNRAPRPKSRLVVDAGRLSQPVKTLQSADAGSPMVSKPKNKEAFKPQSGGLKSRTGAVATGDDVLASVGNTTRRGPSIVEDGSSVVSGGSLKPAGGKSYAAPQSGLTPSSGGNHKGIAGVVDVAGPSGGSSQKSGRKTLLDYGSGNGGRSGGGLSSRQRIAEPTVDDVVAQARSESKPKQAVAEVKLAAQGVNMSITGQIQGRKILSSVAAKYSSQARKKGWEGVVAVHFTVLADGRVKDNMYFDQTSVHRDLNQAARAAIKQFRFAPLGADKAAVEQWGVITIVFKLK